MGLVEGHLRPLWAALGLLVVCVGLTPPAAAQLFSPGVLSRPHRELEGIDNCQKCHAAGKQLDPQLCLDCHRELAPRVARGRGLHGRMPVAERTCERCHAEHLGLDQALVDFGPGGAARFDHTRSGWDLRGAHAKAECAECHDDRLLKDADMLAFRKKWPQRKTYLGLGTECRSCHFDEHRGQLPAACERCHDEAKFAPARGFDHAKTRYALTGKHAQVECSKCHETEEDHTTPRGTFPAPVKPSFVRYQPLEFDRCTDCHSDPHEGRFGRRCTDCHSTADWKKISAKRTSDRDFHDETRYPLRGEHEDVACRSCHGPLPGKKAKFKGLPFARCESCHYDAHAGQLAATRACADCHDVEGFAPVRFDVAAHAATRYPLEGAHAVVACSDCHPREPKLDKRFPVALAKLLTKQRRPRLASQVVLQPERDTSQCQSCHTNLHGSQFDARLAKTGCLGCHSGEAFVPTHFEHDVDSTYPLTGKHAQAPCAGCHVRPKGRADAPVQYVGTPTTCTSCHADEHRGQLTGGASQGQCEVCHTPDAFTPASFDHQDTKRTRFVLEGKHNEATCDKCHPQREVDGRPVRLYRPLPLDCAGCHFDVHEGGMKRFER